MRLFGSCILEALEDLMAGDGGPGGQGVNPEYAKVPRDTSRRANGDYAGLHSRVVHNDREVPTVIVDPGKFAAWDEEPPLRGCRDDRLRDLRTLCELNLPRSIQPGGGMLTVLVTEGYIRGPNL